MKSWTLVAVSLMLANCGGASESAAQNRTFYDWAVAGDDGAAAFEQPYPALDLDAPDDGVNYKGVEVLRGGVHLSRPKNWRLRGASNTPGQAYVQYISPNAYSFALYERPESPRALWRDVLQRFEADVTATGATIVGQRVPVASLGAQGRAYTIERAVEAPKSPLTSRSRELLMRGPHRIVLVQIVVQGDEMGALDSELLRVIHTLEVL